MGIDAKDVCVIVWKVVRFSTNITWRYVKRYPVASCVSAFVIFLYTFYPWIFYFMLYSSPLVACASFYLRNHLSSKMGEEEKRTDRGGLSFVSSEGRTEKAELKHQRSVRRNARREVEEVGKDWDSSQASEDERGKVILTTLYGELLPETMTPDLESFKRDRTLLAAEESFVESNLDKEGYVVVKDPLERVTSETELECSSSSTSSEEEEEEKETNTVVVPWTEDDQKNLMDLGTSEIERNKRLESLISRRRSRRLFLLAAERGLMDMEVPRICIGRNYYGLDRENYETDGLIMPGSAPSVMLPRRNPFDLPYDPQEEKPNLTGDSFQQEFADANPKDILFCRHESFHHRIFPSESQKESSLESLWRKTVDGRPTPLQGSNEQLPLMKESEVEAGEVQIETDSIRNNDDSDSTTTLSPREREKYYNVSDQSDASETFCKRNEDRVRKSVPGLLPRSGSSSSIATARQRYMEHFGYSVKRSHVTTHSVDSDLQVEVSELGSPPSSVDGNDSSDEDRLLFSYESDFGKEMGGESEMKPVEVSSEVEEARTLEPMVPHTDAMFSKRVEEHTGRTEETIVETICLNATETVQEKQEGSEESLINESKSAEDGRSLSMDPSAEELSSHNS